VLVLIEGEVVVDNIKASLDHPLSPFQVVTVVDAV
jgi:hypothetical protein